MAAGAGEEQAGKQPAAEKSTGGSRRQKKRAEAFGKHKREKIQTERVREMKLRKGGRVRGKVKGKGSRRFLRAYALAAAGMLCGVLVFAACGEEYTRISTEVEHFTLQTVALEAGSSHTFDLEEIFSESGLAIEKYVIEGGEDKNYTVRGNTITARGTGICPVNVSLYVPSEDTRYVCSLGTLYSYDEKDFTPVSTADELQGMALDGKYILKSDIDLAGRDWEPVGNYPIDNVFSGMLINPDGYTIENLTISSAENVFHGPYGGCAGGLFGSMQGGFVYGVKLENVRIDVSDFQGNSYSEAGGIAAVINSSYLKDCSVSGEIAAVGAAGGIAGSVHWGYLENCAFSGTVTAREDMQEYAMTSESVGAGGIAGYCGCPQSFTIAQVSIVGCRAEGSVSAVKNAGGIVGYLWGKESVKDNLFAGETSGENAADDFGKVQERA